MKNLNFLKLELPNSFSLIKKEELILFFNNYFATLNGVERDLLFRLNEHHLPTLIHSILVAMDVEYIAENLNYSKEEINSLIKSALFHDAGKLFIHSSILDLGGFKDLEKIWNFSYNQRSYPQNFMTELKVIDVIDYNRSLLDSNNNKDEYLFDYIWWMKSNNVIGFLNKSLRSYLKFHQEATKIELTNIGCESEIIKLAASHHINYFSPQEQLLVEKEVKILELADKFNAILQTEGVRNYAAKLDGEDLLFKLMKILKVEYLNSTSNPSLFERKILKILVEKYFKTHAELFNLVVLLNL